MVEIEKYIKIANEMGFILSNDAISFIRENINYLTQEKFKEILRHQDKILIRKADISRFLPEPKELNNEDYIIEENIHVLFDPGSILRGGKGDYEKLLRDRYSQLVQKIKRYVKIDDFINIADIMDKKYRSNEVILTGLLYRKRINQNRMLVEIEDLTGQVTAYLYKDNNPRLFEQLIKTPLDVVLGLKVFINSKGRAIITDIFPPKVKGRTKERKVRNEIYAVLISDLHIGSKYFDIELFDNLIDILRGHTDNNDLKKLIKRTKYVLIAGDIIDGVGVYKNQENDLEIFDVYQQYEEAYRILKKIPEKYKILIIPGNHDASRSSLPQPPIFKKFASKFYEDNQFLMLGNPVNVSLHDVNTLIYHGDFIQDILSSTPGISQEDINLAVKLLLDYSHLAPQIGLSTKIAPESRDYLVIKDGLSLFHFGHTHKFNISKIYGILCVNSGTFQRQTRYQKMMKIEPDLGKVALVELNSLTPYMVKIT